MNRPRLSITVRSDFWVDDRRVTADLAAAYLYAHPERVARVQIEAVATGPGAVSTLCWILTKGL